MGAKEVKKSIKNNFPDFEVNDEDGTYICLVKYNKNRTGFIDSITAHIREGSFGDTSTKFVVQKFGNRGKLFYSRYNNNHIKTMKRIKKYLNS